jgi:polyisoprenoid-binding protein YceI
VNHRNLLVAALTLVSATTLLAAGKEFKVTEDGKNYASFTSEATLETINGRTSKVTGTIVADPASPETSSTEIVIDLPSIDTGIGMRNDHFRGAGFMDTDKFPSATFKSVSVSSPVKTIEANKPVELKITGDMTIHGVTKRITVPVRVVWIPESELTKSSRGPGDFVHATTNFPIKLSDYGIPVPQKLVMKLADTVNVNIDVFAKPPAPAAAPAAK